MNVIVRLGFELGYYVVAIQCVWHNATKTTLWLGLVSLFNILFSLHRHYLDGYICIFVSFFLFKTKAILVVIYETLCFDGTQGRMNVKEQYWYYFTHNSVTNVVHAFWMVINPKVNVIAQLGFELAYYDVADQHVRYCYTRMLRNEIWGFERDSKNTWATSRYLNLPCREM